MDKLEIVAHFWDEGYNVNDEAKLLKHITTNIELNFPENKLVQMNRSCIMNYDITKNVFDHQIHRSTSVLY